MAQCLISFGANIGNALETIRDAATELQQTLNCGRDQFRISRMFRTPPIGGPAGQPPFVNAVAAIETELSEWSVWDAMMQTETLFGRQRNRRWEARRIDLDILLYNDVRIWTPQLKIPHPRLNMRRFILVPASDVAHDWIDPVTNQTIGKLSERLQSRAGCLTLVSDSRLPAADILQAAASKAVALWRTTAAASAEPSRSAATVRDQFHSRWVSLLSPDHLDHHKGENRSNLLIFLADRSTTEGVAWEDCHRDLAIQMNLVANVHQPGTQQTSIVGPRYLLASDDPEWAVHEIVSALEAMDCPVELAT